MQNTDTRSDNGVAGDELRAFIERIERLEEEKAGIAGDIKEVFAELKGRGFDAKAVRTIIRIRKQDHSERQEQEAILELYMDALGMLADTPLGRAAAGRTFGEEQIERLARKVAADPSVREAAKGLGTPVALTDEERARGGVAAFVGKDGTRCSIEMPGATAAAPADMTMDQAEDQVASAASLKGMAVRTEHLEPGERRDALEAAVRAKGGKVYAHPAPNETIRREREKAAARAGRKKQIGAMEPA